MIPRTPTFQYVILTEEEVLAETKKRFGDREYRIVFILDDLLKLKYFLQSNAHIGTDLGSWQSYCFFNFQQAIYTLHKSYQLWRTGYYLESSILNRHLLEVFVQMRYFENHLSKLATHQTAQRRKDRVQFRDMFDEVSPNSHELIYSKFLSTFAHGNMNVIFRSTLIPPTAMNPQATAQPLIGCQYNDNQANFHYLMIVSIIYGILNYYPTVFPQHTVASDQEFKAILDDQTQWLKLIFDKLKATAADPSLLQALEKIIVP